MLSESSSKASFSKYCLGCPLLGRMSPIFNCTKPTSFLFSITGIKELRPRPSPVGCFFNFLISSLSLLPRQHRPWSPSIGDHTQQQACHDLEPLTDEHFWESLIYRPISKGSKAYAALAKEIRKK